MPRWTPGTCVANSQGIACAQCEDGYIYSARDCAKCYSYEKSKGIFPVLPCLILPVLISIMYITSRKNMPETWGGWRASFASLLFILLNTYQLVAMGKATSV